MVWLVGDGLVGYLWFGWLVMVWFLIWLWFGRGDGLVSCLWFGWFVMI